MPELEVWICGSGVVRACLLDHPGGAVDANARFWREHGEVLAEPAADVEHPPGTREEVPEDTLLARVVVAVACNPARDAWRLRVVVGGDAGFHVPQV